MKVSSLINRTGSKWFPYPSVYFSNDEYNAFGRPKYALFSGNLQNGLRMTWIDEPQEGTRAISWNRTTSTAFVQLSPTYLGYNPPPKTASVVPVVPTIARRFDDGIQLAPIARTDFDWRDTTEPARNIAKHTRQVDVPWKAHSPSTKIDKSEFTVPMGEAATIKVVHPQPAPETHAAPPPQAPVAVRQAPIVLTPPAADPLAGLDLNRLRDAVHMVNAQLALDSGLIAELRDNKLRVVFEI